LQVHASERTERLARALKGGRWNWVGRRVIYAAETYAGALSEVLVHANLGVAPKTQVVVEIDIPDGASSPWLHASTVQDRNYAPQRA
jgi:RES domain-containing protein